MIKDINIGKNIMTKDPEEWIEKNEHIVRNILEEVSDFLCDRIYSDENEWVDTNREDVTGFILHILYNEWIKDHTCSSIFENHLYIRSYV